MSCRLECDSGWPSHCGNIGLLLLLPQVAQFVKASLNTLKTLGGQGGFIAVDRHGHLEMQFNSTVMFRAWSQSPDQADSAIF